MSFAPGGKRVAEWFRIRKSVVTTMSDSKGTEGKQSALREFFAVET